MILAVDIGYGYTKGVGPNGLRFSFPSVIGSAEEITFTSDLITGRAGVLHGTKSYLMESEHGQIAETASIAPGLDYPGVGPEHSFYKDSGRAAYVSVTDAQALEGFQLLSETEGIIPALESAHAIYHATTLAAELPADKLIVVNLSGRGDKDLDIVTGALGMKL